MSHLSSRLWQECADKAYAILDHPFVRGIAEATLDPTAFKYYIAQDRLYLQSFARAYSIAAAKSPDWHAFQSFHELAGGVLDELKLHKSYAESWGLEPESVVASATTRRYTDFLLATAWSSDVGTTAAAMTPCMKLYGFLGSEIAERRGIPADPFGEWVKTYAAPSFHDLVSQLEGLVDRYADDSSAVHSCYQYAIECEEAFFSAAMAEAGASGG